MNNNLVMIVVAAIVIICVIYERLKEKKNVGLAQSGEDMQRLSEAVAKVLPPEAGDYEVIYAHHEDVQHYGRSTRTTYYTYGVAFGDDKLWVVPLGYNKNEIQPARPACFTHENLGVTVLDPTLKNGELKKLSVTLRDKNGANPVFFEVDPMNTRKDRFHHVNIAQQQECDAFRAFMEGLANTVTSENTDLEERMQSDSVAQSVKSSRTLGILGILTCWTGIIGIIFGGIGLLASPKPSETGGKACLGRVLCLVSTILSALVIVAFIITIAMS